MEISTQLTAQRRFFAKERPLAQEWAIYFDKVDGGPNPTPPWPQNLRRLGAFSTVKEMWGWFDDRAQEPRLPAPSALLSLSSAPGSFRASSGYYLFRSDVPPQWEHPANLGSGKLVLDVSRESGDDPSSFSLLADRVWKSVLCACVGEKEFAGTPKRVLGCTMTTKKDRWRLAFWIEKSQPDEIAALSLRVGALLARTYLSGNPVGIRPSFAPKLGFLSHNPNCPPPKPAPSSSGFETSARGGGFSPAEGTRRGASSTPPRRDYDRRNPLREEPDRRRRR